MESIGGILVVKKFVNRGFLIGPYCPVYGTGVVLLTIILKNYTDNIFTLFILSTIICGILEYFTSYIMEKIFKARWWDYTNKKFNIKGRICLKNLILFAIAGTIILYFLNPFFINIYLKIPKLLRYIIITFLSIFFIIDILISFYIIYSLKNETYLEKDNTEEITNKVKDKKEDILIKASSDVIILKKKVNIRRLKTKYKMVKSTNSLIELVKNIKKQRERITDKLINKQQKVIDKTISKLQINNREKNKS